MTASPRPIYLDHGATTAVDERVLNAMLPFFRENFGNAASKSHRFGWDAAAAVDDARQQVARLIGAKAKEIIFTSGATEANNLAITGGARARALGQASEGRTNERVHVVVSAAEHKAILDPAAALEREGFDVTRVPVSADGTCTAEAVATALTDATGLVSVMLANNEIGTINPIKHIARVCQERNITFHVDAAQAAGKVPVDVATLGVDLLSLSAHKMYGPKGIGALYVRKKPRTPGQGAARRVPIVATMFGGGHERGLRSGTLDVPSIVGFGAAAEIASEHLQSHQAHLRHLRDALWEGLSTIDAVTLHGPLVDALDDDGDLRRLPDNLSLAFSCVEAEMLLLKLSPVVALSAGSACTSAQLSPSHVLRAIGCSSDRAHSTIRFGVGRENTRDEIDLVIEAVRTNVDALRGQSAQWQARSPQPRET